MIDPTSKVWPYKVARSQFVQEAEETHKLVMWTGKVKHRLKTAEGASTVELFSISALIPEKLIEQMPPTLFVSALAGMLPFAVLLFSLAFKHKAMYARLILGP